MKPLAIVVARGIRAEVVEWRGLKPCWVGLAGRMLVRKDRMRRSRILLAGHRREIGRYDLMSFGLLFGAICHAHHTLLYLNINMNIFGVS